MPRSFNKQKLQNAMSSEIEARLLSLSKARKSIEESKHNETKSSAGDKYETSRAMLQMELDKISTQIDKITLLKHQLDGLAHEDSGSEAALGTLVITDRGNFYISISLGKLVVDDQEYFALSAEAPLAKLLMSCSKGDHVDLRDRRYQILQLI